MASSFPAFLIKTPSSLRLHILQPRHRGLHALKGLQHVHAHLVCRLTLEDAFRCIMFCNTFKRPVFHKKDVMGKAFFLSVFLI